MALSYSFHLSNRAHAVSTVYKLSGICKHNERRYGDNSTRSYDNEQESDNKSTSTYGTSEGKAKTVTSTYDKNKVEIIYSRTGKTLYQDVQQLYHDEFDKVVEEYNKNQKRPSRRIKDYLKYVSDAKQNDVAAEVIIQLGDEEFWKDKSLEDKQSMKIFFNDQLEKLQKLCPNFKIANAVIHLDEKSPHMHVVGVPVAEGYSRGLSKRVSKTKVFTERTLEKLQSDMREDMKLPPVAVNVPLQERSKGRNLDFTKKELTEYNEQKKSLEKQISELKIEKEGLSKKINEESINLEKTLDQIVYVNGQKSNRQWYWRDETTGEKVPVPKLPVLTKEIKEKEKEINRLQTDIERLKNEYSANDLEAIKAENETLKAENADLKPKAENAEKVFKMFQGMMNDIKKSDFVPSPVFRSRVSDIADCMNDADCAELEEEWAREDQIALNRRRRAVRNHW